MKKIFFLLITLLSFSAVQAQYQEGMIIGNAGLGFGVIGYNYGVGYSGGFVPLTLNAEYSLDDTWAVGGYVGYFSRSYTYANPGGDAYKNKFSVFSFGGRATFHATEHLNDWFDGTMDARKLDLYASALLGYEVYSWNYDENFPDTNLSSSRFILGPVVGARYWFTETVGGYAELGRGAFSFVTLGVSLYLY